MGFFVKKCFILNFATGTVMAIFHYKKVSSHRISLVLFVLSLSHNGAPLLLRANPKIPQRYATSALTNIVEWALIILLVKKTGD